MASDTATETTTPVTPAPAPDLAAENKLLRAEVALRDWEIEILVAAINHIKSNLDERLLLTQTSINAAIQAARAAQKGE